MPRRTPPALGWIAIAAAACLLSTSARAEPAALDVPLAEPKLELQEPSQVYPPRRRLWHARDGGRPSLLVPVLEVPAIQTLFWGLDTAGGADYSHITLNSIRNHFLHGPWEWDHDNFWLNELGHPFHGSFDFTAARSAGLSFWESVPFVVAGAGMWELVFETDPPSKNDMITTPLGGIAVGESLHRLSLLVLDEGEPSIPRSLLSWAVEPVGGINRYLFGRPDADFFARPPYWAQLSLGVNINVNNFRETDHTRITDQAGPQLHLAIDVLYGVPGEPGLRLRDPFDHFAFSAELDLSRDSYAALFSRGLLVGRTFDSERFAGLWGLFLGYDYASPGTLRVSTVNLGLGASAQIRLPHGIRLLPTLEEEVVPFGAGGGIATPVVSRDYHYGPGGAQLAELQLLRDGVGRVAVTARGYVISGKFVGEGSERIGYLSALAELMLTQRQGVGIEAFFADRRASYENLPEIDVHQRASQLRFYWTLVLRDAYAPTACPPVP